MAAAYEQFVLDRSSQESLRSAGNGVALIAALIAAPETAGGSYAAYLTMAGGVVASVDIALKNDRLKLNSDADFKAKYQSYYDVWDIFYNSVLLADAGAGVYSLANNLRKVNLVNATKTFYAKMKDFDFNGELMGVWNKLRGVQVATLETLVSKFSTELKTTYDDLINFGLTPEAKANTILLRNSENVTVATIYDGKFTPTKWKWAVKATDYSQTVTKQGYIILKNGDDICFDLGFKEGRVLKADEVNHYLQATKRAQLEGQPYFANTDVIDVELKEGETFYVVEYKKAGTPNPGGFGSKDPISTIKELREDVAVLREWKNPDVDDIVIREYTVTKPIKVRSGIIGSELEKTGVNAGKTYPGGAHQYEFYDYLGGDYWEKFANCKNKNGIELK